MREIQTLVSFEGIHVQVLSTEYANQAYLKQVKIKKAEKMEKWLEENRLQNARTC